MIRGRHVLYGLLGAFGVILIANGAFVYFAATTFPGNETDDSYRRGLAYNETLSADEAQRAAGWAASVEVVSGGVAVDLATASSGPAAGMTLIGELRRPGAPRSDIEVVFSEIAVGRYHAAVDLAPGRWNLSAQAIAPGGEVVLRVQEDLEIEGY